MTRGKSISPKWTYLQNISACDYKLLLQKPSLRVLRLDRCFISLITLVVCIKSHVIDNRFKDSFYCICLCLFSLPQLPKLSIKFTAPVDWAQVESIFHVWSEKNVQMRALELLMMNGESGRGKLETVKTMATSVKIEYCECVPHPQILHIRFH